MVRRFPKKLVIVIKSIVSIVYVFSVTREKCISNLKLINSCTWICNSVFQNSNYVLLLEMLV